MTTSENQNSSITAARLYNYMICEHRVWRDIYGPKEERLPETNPFVQLLWERGAKHEVNVVQQLGDFIDLRHGTLEERFHRTLAAMRQGAAQIYQGVLMNGKLLGVPDILRLKTDGNYVPVEIKSGRGEEGSDETGTEGKPKKTYAVQLALYADLLIQLGFCREHKGIVIDIDFNEIEYDLDQFMGVRIQTTYWEHYLKVSTEVERLVTNQQTNTPALCGACSLCAWHDSCRKWIAEADDLTGVFYLGRKNRSVIVESVGIQTIQEAADIDTQALLVRKKADKGFLKGIGPEILKSIKRRANILKNIKAPVLHEKVEFPKVVTEIFFDIEDDPTQDFVYLHGVLERKGDNSRYLNFTARSLSQEAEKQAWSAFWRYMDEFTPGSYAIYYYSSHEKTAYRAMQKKYPDVVSEARLEEFFQTPYSIDLYTSVILKHTDWPLSSYSIKAIATYLGFVWRDETPSGALSIQWFNQYLETGDEAVLQRLLDYNEDDCRATMVLKDKLQELSDTLAA